MAFTQGYYTVRQVDDMIGNHTITEVTQENNQIVCHVPLRQTTMRIKIKLK